MNALEIEEPRREYEEHIKQGIRENEMTQEMELNEKVKRLNDIIQNVARETIPENNKPNNPWILEQTLHLARENREIKQETAIGTKGGRVQAIV